MLVIGITGTLGAGKGTVVEYLVENFHFSHFSVRSYLTKILEQKGIEPNRDNFTTLANQLRKDNHSPSFLIEELYREAALVRRNAIIESIRTIGEIDKLKSLGPFFLLAVDADREIRYQRIINRKSETDRISFEQFIADEEREMTATDANMQNISACIRLANYKILNNGDREDLHAQIDQFIKENKIV